nr:2-oxo-4-hydroxy-4-carboxy-5-ureidoimidazoline decarboxylase-like [Danaus plexippus plexippus]
MSGLINISEVNSMKENEFQRVFGNVIELCESAAVSVKDTRPFKGLPDLCAAFNKYLDDLNLEGKIEILKSHPDLAGRLAARNELTRESANEQRSAGLTDLTFEQKSTIEVNNERYKSKFGFPFIICARENKVQSIIEGLQRRYNNSREQEIITGINEVKKICRLRILDIVRSEE